MVGCRVGLPGGKVPERVLPWKKSLGPRWLPGKFKGRDQVLKIPACIEIYLWNWGRHLEECRVNCGSTCHMDLGSAPLMSAVGNEDKSGKLQDPRPLSVSYYHISYHQAFHLPHATPSHLQFNLPAITIKMTGKKKTTAQKHWSPGAGKSHQKWSLFCLSFELIPAFA